VGYVSSNFVACAGCPLAARVSAASTASTIQGPMPACLERETRTCAGEVQLSSRWSNEISCMCLGRRLKSLCLAPRPPVASGTVLPVGAARLRMT